MQSKKIGKKGNPGSKRTKIIKNRKPSVSKKNLRTKKKVGAGLRNRNKNEELTELKKGLKQIYDMIEKLNQSLETNIESYENEKRARAEYGSPRNTPTPSLANRQHTQ